MLATIFNGILQNPIFINTITFFFGAALASTLARYKITKPMQIKIATLQLEKAYIPLYKIICKKEVDPLTAEDKITKIKEIANTHIELIFPTLFTLLEQTPVDLDKVSRNIEAEYLFLKKTLGYPSSTTFQILKRNPLGKNLRLLCTVLPAIAALIGSLSYLVYLAISDLQSFIIVVAFYTILYSLYRFFKFIQW